MAPKAHNVAPKPAATEPLPPTIEDVTHEDAQHDANREAVDEKGGSDTGSGSTLGDSKDVPDEYDDANLDGDEDEDDLGSIGNMFNPLQQLMEVLVTEESEPIVDVLAGIRAELAAHTKELVTQNKILFKLAKSLEASRL